MARSLWAVLLIAALAVTAVAAEAADDDVLIEDDDLERLLAGDDDALANMDPEQMQQLREMLAAQQAQQEPDINNMGSPDAEFSYVFPEFPTKQFPSGDIVDVVMGIHNKGQRPFTIELLQASLTAPNDFGYFVENYTRFEYNLPVAAREDGSFLYRFRPDPVLEPRQYGLVGRVLYKTDERQYFSHFFNGTVEIVEAEGAWDAQAIFSTTLYAGVAALVGLMAFRFNSGGSATAASVSVKAGAADGAEGDDWLAHLDKKKGAKSPKSPKRRQ